MVVGDVPLAWSVWPLPVVLLFATWWCAPDWIEERRGRRFDAAIGRESGHPRPDLAGRSCPTPCVLDPGGRSGILGRRIHATVDRCRATDPRSVRPGVEEVLGRRTSVWPDAAVAQERAKLALRSDMDPKAEVPRRTHGRNWRFIISSRQYSCCKTANQRPAVPLGLITARSFIVRVAKTWCSSPGCWNAKPGNGSGPATWTAPGGPIAWPWRWFGELAFAPAFLLVEEADRLEGSVL